VAVDIIERMFETGSMTLLAPALDDVESPAEQRDVVRELQDRIRRMQRNKLDTRELPTNPALVDLLPGGALAAGSSYIVAGSTTLALALLQHPGDQWLSVVSALVDVVSVLLVRPPLRQGQQGDVRVRITDGAAGRLSSRLRQREAVLIGVDDWPGAEARLTVTESSWAGLGSGFGHLSGRQVTVSSTATRWQGRAKSRRLWMPGPDQTVSAVAAAVPFRTSAGAAARLSTAR
jgi:hypothetical protein